MKSRTSFFNPTVLRKDITRFAPLWALYTVFTLMALLLLWNSYPDPAQFANSASGIMQSMGIVNFCYAGLCAALLFGDLFSSRLCNALHAMPMRREGWFLTHFTAGLLFCLVPNLLAALICALLLQQYYWLALLWLGLMVLQFLFFFGVGAFACVSAGSRLGAIAIYGIIHFFAVIALLLITAFYEPFLYGIQIDTEAISRLSPVVRFTGAEYIYTYYDKMAADHLVIRDFVGADWRYAGIAAAVGLLLTGAAVLVYRKRQLESAGDLISFSPIRPVVLVIYTLCVGSALYFIGEMSDTKLQYLFLALGLVIGFFTGRMLLERKVNVFRGKNFLAFAILLAALGLSIGLVRLDPTGITRYVPDAQQVQQVRISPYPNYHYNAIDAMVITEPEDIIDLHRSLINNRLADGDSTLYLEYTLKSGRTVERRYPVSTKSDAGKQLQGYYSSMAYLLHGYTPQQILKNGYLFEFHSYYPPSLESVAVYRSEYFKDQYWFQEKYGDDGGNSWLAEDLSGGKAVTGLDVELLQDLFAAIEADCKAGTMVQLWEYHTNKATAGQIIFEYYIPQNGQTMHSLDQVRSLSITVFEECENTLAFLKSITE